MTCETAGGAMLVEMPDGPHKGLCIDIAWVWESPGPVEIVSARIEGTGIALADEEITQELYNEVEATALSDMR